jgi:hypothetical protein
MAIFINFFLENDDLHIKKQWSSKKGYDQGKDVLQIEADNSST